VAELPPLFRLPFLVGYDEQNYPFVTGTPKWL